jgi:hypothetical protein
MSAPILSHWDVQIIVETDTSDYALTAILSILDTDGEVHPVAFCLRHSQHPSSITMSMTKNYSQYLKHSKTW